MDSREPQRIPAILRWPFTMDFGRTMAGPALPFLRKRLRIQKSNENSIAKEGALLYQRVFFISETFHARLLLLFRL